MAGPYVFFKKAAAGLAAGAANFRKDIESGFGLVNLLTAKQNQAAGFAASQAPATLRAVEEGGVAVSTFSSGTSKPPHDAGMQHQNRVVLQLLAEHGIQQQQTVNYTGTKWTTTATNIGADNWTNVTNAQGANDGSNATRNGQTLGSTDGQIRCQFSINGSGEKDQLTIDLVELRFYVQQTGTTLNNGGLELDWRIGSSGAWTNLATYTNNQNFLTTPDAHDITGTLTWANIRDIEARVRLNVGAGTTLVQGVCDAVLLHVEASLLE